MKAMLTPEQVFEIAKMHIDKGEVDRFNDNFMFMPKQMRMMLPGNENTLLTQLITEVEALRPKIRKITGDPFYQCYSITGHDYDQRGYCKVCHNPSHDLFENEGKESKILDQVLSLLKKHKDQN